MITAFVIACTGLFQCPVIIATNEFHSKSACYRHGPEILSALKSLPLVIHGERYTYGIICSKQMPENNPYISGKGFDI